MPSKNRFARFLVLVGLFLLPLLGGCRLVASGTLGYVPANPDPEANTGSTVSVLVFRHEEGDVWPPEGMLGLLVSAENMPWPPETPGGPPPGLPPNNHYSLLPARFYAGLGLGTRAGTCDELTTGGRMMVEEPGAGLVHVRDDGTIQEWLTVPDTPAFWENSHWALTHEYVLGTTYAFRCGAISVVQ